MARRRRTQSEETLLLLALLLLLWQASGSMGFAASAVALYSGALSTLAVFLALVSSVKDSALPDDIVAFGEIGLTGEIRSVACAELRLREAARLGFKRAAVSKFSKSAARMEGIKAGGFRSVADALSLIEA